MSVIVDYVNWNSRFHISDLQSQSIIYRIRYIIYRQQRINNDLFDKNFNSYHVDTLSGFVYCLSILMYGFCCHNHGFNNCLIISLNYLSNIFLLLSKIKWNRWHMMNEYVDYLFCFIFQDMTLIPKYGAFFNSKKK